MPRRFTDASIGDPYDPPQPVLAKIVRTPSAMLTATTCEELKPLALSADAVSGVASMDFRSNCNSSSLVCATTSSTFARTAHFDTNNDAGAGRLQSIECDGDRRGRQPCQRDDDADGPGQWRAGHHVRRGGGAGVGGGLGERRPRLTAGRPQYDEQYERERNDHGDGRGRRCADNEPGYSECVADLRRGGDRMDAPGCRSHADRQSRYGDDHGLERVVFHDD